MEIQTPTHLLGENYSIMLKESINRYLSEIQRPISDFSSFEAIFYRLLQSKVNPPLETIWFYSAVRYRSSVGNKDGIFRVKELFQLITCCSSSCDGLKSVGLICPVLFELYGVVVELFGKKVEKIKKVRKEVECLIEGVLGYIGVCGCVDFGRDDGLGDLGDCFKELVRVWTVDRVKGDAGIGERLKVFMPLVSDEIRDGFGRGEFGGGYLVGVVIVQAFLLRLCLKVHAGAGLSKVELQKELTSWAVGSITVFRNCCFFEVLLRLLLESTLPITSLLDSKEDAFLRKVLYDAVILVDYSFLNIEREIIALNYMKRLAVRWLIVVHEATQDARGNGDHTKAISYINAFSRSCLPLKLIKWATFMIGMDDETSKLDLTTPQALLKWLLKIDDQGLRVFENNNLKLCAKLVLSESKSGYEHRLLQPNSEVGDDLLFYIDNKREGEEEKADDQEMVEAMDAAFAAAAKKFAASDQLRKRKEGVNGEDKTKYKILKYNLHDSSVKENVLPSITHGDLTSSDSEEETQTPASDEDMGESDD